MQPPVACPVCGAYSLTQDAEASALLAVCDVLVLKALERVGDRIVRAVRARHNALGTRPKYMAHTLWPTEDEWVDKALKGAWDVVPALLDGQGFQGAVNLAIVDMLDAYVHDLVITGTRHTLSDLAYRFEYCLGLPVYLNATAATG